MSHELLQMAYVGVFFLIPGSIGAYVAHTKGKNPFLWFLLNALFPPTLMIIFFQGPARPVPGHYRLCPKCGAYSKWRETACRFCQTDLSA